MSEPASNPDPAPTDAKTLFRIMNLSSTMEPDWTAAELAEIWPHQLRAPLAAELERIIPGAAQQIAQICSAISPPLLTFADLFSHPNPPLDLLKLVKEFAKLSPHHPEQPIPKEVASVIYLAAIVIAERQWRQRITHLSDEKLSESMAWVRSQLWLDPATRSLFGPQ